MSGFERRVVRPIGGAQGEKVETEGPTAMDQLWAVTSYFNPLRWQSRLENYRCFRRRLGVPLITVEWSPTGRFELCSDDAEVLIQVQGGDLMWQKERLLNRALARLPPEAESVAWLDCDIVFCEPRWKTLTCEALEAHEMVQLFSDIYHLGSAQTQMVLDARDEEVVPRRRVLQESPTVPSATRMVLQTGADDLVGRLETNPGVAWAAKRQTLEQIGLFDRGIIGGGAYFCMLGILGTSAKRLEARKEAFSYLTQSSYPSWAEAAYDRIQRRIGYLEVAVAHLHHGDLRRRHYRRRHFEFNRLEIDIETDIRRSGEGPWEFVSPRPEWTAFMREYFLERQDDG